MCERREKASLSELTNAYATQHSAIICRTVHANNLQQCIISALTNVRKSDQGRDAANNSWSVLRFVSGNGNVTRHSGA